MEAHGSNLRKGIYTFVCLHSTNICNMLDIATCLITNAPFNGQDSIIYHIH